MKEKKKTNFEQMAENSRSLFLSHCKYSIAGKYETDFDEDYLYIRFFGVRYRIGRGTAITECLKDGCWSPAGPGETMIFYDLFCYGDPYAKASGTYVNLGSLIHQLSATSNPGEGMFARYVHLFEGHINELKAACEALGGIPCGKGDAAYELPVFEFMKCRFEFWEADEDFPASIVLFMDGSILKFMHYETTWYLADRILENISLLL